MSDSLQYIAGGAIGPSCGVLVNNPSEGLERLSFARIGDSQFVVAQFHTAFPDYHAFPNVGGKAAFANRLHARVSRMIKYRLRRFFSHSHPRTFELNLGVAPFA